MLINPPPTNLDLIIKRLSKSAINAALIKKAVEMFGGDFLYPVAKGMLTDVAVIAYDEERRCDAKSQSKIESENPLFDMETYINSPRPGATTLRLPLSPAVRHFSGAWRAESTKRRWESSFRKMVGHCVELNVAPWPMDTMTAIEVIAAEAWTCGSYSTVSAMRDTMSVMALIGGVQDPTKSYEFRRVWSGIRRELGTDNPNRKIALTRSDVSKMLREAIKCGHFEHAVLLAVAFEGAFRRAEVLALDVRDVTIGSDGAVSIRVRRSKTDQTGRGESVRLLVRHDAPFNAPLMLRKWLDMYPRTEGPLFPTMSNGVPTSAPQCYRHVVRMVKRYAASACGLSPDQVAMHSLRAGYCTAEIDLGRNFAEVAAHMRHSSLDLLTTYYRPRGKAPAFAAAAATGVTTW